MAARVRASWRSARSRTPAGSARSRSAPRRCARCRAQTGASPGPSTTIGARSSAPVDGCTPRWRRRSIRSSAVAARPTRRRSRRGSGGALPWSLTCTHDGSTAIGFVKPSNDQGGFMQSVLLDAAGHRRSRATMPGYHRGRPPRNKGEHYPADPPTVEEIVAVMRSIGDRADGQRLRALIVLLWRAGLRIGEALALQESDLDRDPRRDPRPPR